MKTPERGGGARKTYKTQKKKNIWQSKLLSQLTPVFGCPVLDPTTSNNT